MARLYISPSTQDWNRYAGGKTNEEVEMRKVALLAANRLAMLGHTVRVGGVVSAYANAVDGNVFGPDLYIALHTNAGGGMGCEVWHYTGNELGHALAQAIYDEVAVVTHSPDRGTKHSTGYIELSHPRATAVIVEFQFHDNATGVEEILSHEQEYADAVVRGIVKIVGGTPIPVPPLPTPPPVRYPPVPWRGRAVRNTWWARHHYDARVDRWQSRMRVRRWNIDVDGKYGPQSAGVAMEFQEEKGLTVDGVLGKETYTAAWTAPIT